MTQDGEKSEPFAAIDHLQVRDAARRRLVGNPVTPIMSRAMRATSSALPHELHFMIDVISAARRAIVLDKGLGEERQKAIIEMLDRIEKGGRGPPQ